MVKQIFNSGGATIDASSTNAQYGQICYTDAMHRVSTTIASVIFAAICFLASFAAVPAYAAAGDFTVVTVGTINAITTPSGNADGGGTYAWDENTNTLTLTGATIASDGITIVGYDAGKTANIVISGTVNVTGQITCGGSLIIRGSSASDVLNATETNDKPAIASVDDITVETITVNVSTTGSFSDCIVSTSGGFNMASGVLNLSATGAYSGGVKAQVGDINISGTAQVKTNPSVTGTGLHGDPNVNISGGVVVDITSTGDVAINAEAKVTIDGGTVTAKGAGSWDAAMAGFTDGVTVTGGTVTVGGVGENNGNIYGDLTVSGSGANVTVNGNITNGGDLTVSNGTVNITGTVSGATSVTGGTVSVNGTPIPPGGGAITTEADLISALQSGTASTITLGGNITLSTVTVSMGASHTIETGNFILTISGGENYSTGGRIDLGTHTLTLKGNAVIESVQGIRSANGTLNLENVTATLKIANSIYAGTVNVNSDATVNLNSNRSDGLGGSLLTLRNNTSLNINSGGTVNIQNAYGNGIDNSNGGAININSGGVINIGAIAASNWGISQQGSGVLKLNSGGTLNGTAGGAIYLENGTKVDGMNGKFNDQGTALTAAGEITVGAVDASISATGLSAGLYVWNGSAFVKAGATTYTATLNIYRDNAPYSNDGTAYTLKLDGDETTTVNMTGAPGATRTASVANGTWKVYQYGDEYTGVNIVIANAPGDARHDLYTGSYTVNPQGAATGGTFSAAITGIGGDSYNIDFGTLPASFYFKGDAVTFTATGEGADSYTYAWSGTHGGTQISGTGATYTILSVTGTIDLTCTITGSAPTAPTITTPTLPNGIVGAAYSHTLAAIGTTPITWTIESGNLPAGLSLNSSTGEISGIPTTEETATFTVKASNGVLPDDTKPLSITIQKSTGIEDVDNLPSKSLKAWTHGERLHVSGLTSGQTWRVYNISGMLLYHDIAEGDEADVSLSARGVYIVQSGSVTVKVAY